jgi:hypothetical protein
MALRTSLIPLEDRSTWDAALAGIPHAPAHTWEYRWALSRSSDAPVWLLVAESEEGRFACPVAERWFAGEPDGFTPYGFAGPIGSGDATVLEAGVDRVAEERGWVASYLGLHPVLAHPALLGSPGAVSRGAVHVLDLTLDAQELLRRVTPGNRRRLRDLPGLAGDIDEGSVAMRSFFIDTYPKFMRDRGAAAVYDLSSDTLEALCSLSQGTIVGLTRDDPSAAALFTWTDSGAEWNFGVRRAEQAHSLLPLVWTMVLRLKAAGRPWINLGGGIREGDGVEIFKEQLGGSRRPIVALRRIHRPDAYARLCRIAGSSGATEYFPAYRSHRGIAPSGEGQASSGLR